MAAAEAWGALACASGLGLVASGAVSALPRPRPVAPWRRPWAANATHVGVWLMACAAEATLFGRPYFAMVNVLAVELVIVLVSLAKYDALREPFVFQDFGYFIDAVRYPRLYLPFFPWTHGVAAIAGYALALWLGLAWEPAVIHAGGPRAWAGVAAMALLGAGLALSGGRRLTVTFEAEEDLRRLGLPAALWAYWRAERAAPGEAPMHGPFASSGASGSLGSLGFLGSSGSPVPLGPSTRAVEVTGDGPARLPDLVSIQSESFFDARRVYPQIKADVLRAFDRLRAEAVMHGELDVVARGANTVRTEFAFLSGLTPGELGVHRFNPYRALARRGVPTLASYLRGLGYRTICVHPYHGAFYGRDQVLGALGFDTFIDIRAFGENKKDGANIGDRILAGYVRALLERDDSRPVFIHVITMENHGPLHLETVTEDDARQVLDSPLPPGCEDLVAYARHLRNADAMFSSLRAALLRHGRPAALCVYGDHIPIMPGVYRALGSPSGTTDALIWVAGQVAGGARRLHVSTLAAAFLRSAGVWPPAP